MTVSDAAGGIYDEMKEWRRAIHQNPEIAFNEQATARFVAGKLAEFGLEVERGLAKTGVVAKLTHGRSGRAIGLRADMDALQIHEKTNLPYASRNEGVMHACGHDGHTAMLLGAAKLLAESPTFDGSVYFIFQPAEENEGGGRAMVEDGLFDDRPMDAVFGLHNWPGLAFGEMAMRAGCQMAAVDNFIVRFSGRGAHVAMPHLGDDPILAVAEFIQDAQSIVSRRIDPRLNVVLSFSALNARSEAGNVIPAGAEAKGTVRFFEPALGAHVGRELELVASSIAKHHGMEADIAYAPGYPPVVNDAVATDAAAKAAAAVVGAGKVRREFAPSLGCEDFAFMLGAKRGCYAWLGAGADERGRGLHSAHYDFNDALLPIGTSYWLELVRQQLPLRREDG